MINAFWTTSLAGLAVLSATAAGAQTPETPRRAGRGGATMTLQDFTARAERRMLAGDVDGDGRVSRAEFQSGGKSGKGGKGGKGDPARRFGRLDRNGDGMVDRQEIGTVAARRFARLDADRNGSLTREERAAARTAAADPDDTGA
ncbi:signal transduction protein [Sphingomonas arantia]|uniref:Signal transduction protein n=1 Tax=Sphingomonas arantia TaxID=1460676 RepID=A0ABW4TZ16_9SPHN